MGRRLNLVEKPKKIAATVQHFEVCSAAALGSSVRVSTQQVYAETAPAKCRGCRSFSLLLFKVSAVAGSEFCMC